MRSFGTFVKKSSSSDENSVLRSDESGRSRLVSEALQSSWVLRLRSGGHCLKRRETQNPKPCAGIWSRISDGRIGSGFNVNPNKDPSGFLLQSSGALLLEDKIEDADIEKESDSAIHAHFLPKDSTFIDLAKENQSPRASVYREDPGTATRMIASFGPFQVRATSLMPKPSFLDVSEPSTTFMGKPTLASVPWKQYFHGIHKEEPFDQRTTRDLSGTSGLDIKSRTENEDGKRKEFRGGLLRSAPVDSYPYPHREYRAMVKYCGKKRDPHWKANQATGDNGRSSQLQRQAESQQPGSMGQNAGLYNEVMPLTGDGDVHGNGLVMDGTSSKRCKIPFPNAVQRIMGEIESDGVAHCAQHSSLPSLIPHFTVSKQLLQTETCDNHHFVGQHSIWKQGSESLPMIKAHQLENPTGKHCTGPYNLTLPLGPSTFGSAQELGTFNTMERLPAYSPIHPIFGNQKDDMIPTDNNSSSTASLPQEIYANLCNRTANQTISSECHVCQAKATSATKGIDACYYRPRRDPDFLEPTSNSHFSNCQWHYQDETPAGAENRHLNQLEIAGHSVSDAKGKGPSIPRISWEQWHDRKHIASSKGVASHYKSDDDVIHRTFKEKYAGPFSHCSDSRSIFQSVAPAVQAVALSVPTKECQETVTVRDGHKKGNSNKNKKFSAVDQNVLQAKESPTGHAGYCYYEINCDSCEYCHPKSRKQSAEARPASQRVLISSNERESKSDSDKYARLTISAVDGHTLNSGKRTHCTLQDNLALAPTISSKAATMREVNASDDHRAQMWLQRWIHSGGSADLLRREVPRESTNCNLVTNVGSIARSSFGGWSGNNRKADIVQWTKGRRKGSIDHFSERNSQALGKRYFDSKLKGNQFLKNVFTSSASAMAIMGTRDEEKYVAQPPRKRRISSFMTSNDLELKPTKNAFDQRTAEHKDAHI